MKLTEWTLKNRTVFMVFALLLVLGGLKSYLNLGRLEFPEFTIKTAVVTTQYPGATAREVEEEVTDPIETAVQQLSQIKKVRSISQAGQSIVYVDIKDKFMGKDIPQIWDELRRKVGDLQPSLPAGIVPSLVDDDFGDEYGIFFALTGEGYTYKELKDYADLLKRELLLVKDVGSVEIWGNRQEVVWLEMERSRMAELGISVQEIIDLLNRQHRIVDAGHVKAGAMEVRIRPTGGIDTIAGMGDLLLRTDDNGSLIRLRDVATFTRGYADPARWMMRHNGLPALGLGISIASGGNVVKMGAAVKKRIAELESEKPLGMVLDTIAYQADTVSTAVNGFVVNLVEAVLIVVGVLCVAMGMFSGLLIGAILLFTIFGTFILMDIYDVFLQLISLGALILALGMLVDNAIVVTEGIIVRVQQGEDAEAAALETVRTTAWPLLGATVVAILAFAAIGTSQNSTGEFCGSLFYVLGFSLGMSWLLAVTLTPLLCVMFLKEPPAADEDVDPYGGKFFTRYRSFLARGLERRYLVLAGMVGLLFLSVWGFGFVENSFFPKSGRPQFMIDIRNVEGTRLEETAADMDRVAAHIRKMDNVTATTNFAGEGALRFLLTYEPEDPSTAYGQILVTVDDYEQIDNMISQIQSYLDRELSGAETKISKFTIGPGGGAKIEARFSGPDPAVLRELSEQARAIMATDANAYAIRDDWRQMVPVLVPQVKEANARRLGLSRPDIAGAIAVNASGLTAGMFRDENILLPIILRLPESERSRAERIGDVYIQRNTGDSVALAQAAPVIKTLWEAPIIRRENRQRTITVMCDPLEGNASVLFNRIRSGIENIPLPDGYKMEWGGEYEDSADAQESLFRLVPLFFIAMVLIVIMLFNAIRQPTIIFLCLPLALIGVTSGLLLFRESFGFMSLLGLLSLSGMLIKNAVVLIDQIDMEIGEGKPPFAAILDASVSRMRPVLMAALTTVLGMIPLVFDPFYASMSVTIMGGLTFGTVLTLVVVPVLYACFFRVPSSMAE